MKTPKSFKIIKKYGSDEGDILEFNNLRGTYSIKTIKGSGYAKYTGICGAKDFFESILWEVVVDKYDKLVERMLND